LTRYFIDSGAKKESSKRWIRKNGTVKPDMSLWETRRRHGEKVPPEGGISRKIAKSLGHGCNRESVICLR